jgi:hypothetical protein
VAALREALIRSIILDPDAVDEREPLWIEFLRTKYGVA